jgi:hypothetical protein
MHTIYWAHSYRPEDATINEYFGLLLEGEKAIVNFDPPSKTVNASKLERNLRACDGMVAVLSWRSTGPSPYILYEISLCLRARKPLLVFIDDRLPNNVIPPWGVLQRHYSQRTYFRQGRQDGGALPPRGVLRVHADVQALLGRQPQTRHPGDGPRHLAAYPADPLHRHDPGVRAGQDAPGEAPRRATRHPQVCRRGIPGLAA